MKKYLLLLLLAFGIGANAQQQFQTIFKAGQDGYQSFRIPSIVKSNKVLLAFCEGRVNNASDYGNIDIVMKRSTDNGKTWSALQIVAENGNLQAGNAAPVVDDLDPKYPKGRIFLFYNTGNAHEYEVIAGKGVKRCLYKTSVDNGLTWSAAVDITLQVHKPNQPAIDPAFNFAEDWRGYANTPGHALQLTNGHYKGRIFVAANHTAGDKKDGKGFYLAHGFYTDNHGQSFQLSEDVKVKGGNESMAVELSGGRLMMNSRNQKGDIRQRIVSVSTDGGIKWDTTYFDKQLIDPVCQASLVNLGVKKGKSVIAFCNPADTKYRNNLTLKISEDDGTTWTTKQLIYADDANKTKSPAAYSDLVRLNNRTLGILFEKDNYGEISFTTVKW